ncbi:MAG: hypothetical protein AAF664_02990 [Planctomycetota bacterium]
MAWQNRRLGWWFAVAVCLLVGMLGCGGPSSENEEVSAAPASQPDSSDAIATAKVPETKPEEPLAALPDGEAEDGGYTISQVMQIAHETKLYRRLYKDEVPPEVLAQFTTLYGDLVKRTPPDGDLDDWKKRATALNDAVALIAGGDASGVSQLKRAINCNSCHSRHRG